MDRERIQKQQSIKLIVSETIMVLAVILTVIILALLVSGYWINSNFEVERQGMLQIYSTPTGANVLVDGESSWLQRTNTSKVLPSGEHVVTLSRDGYDSWSKTINISEGLLYKIHYPRLFLQKRESEKAYSTSGVIMATVSPDRNKLLYFDNTMKCFIMSLENETIKPKELNVVELFGDDEPTSSAKISLLASSGQADWSKDNNHILFHIASEGVNEWIVLDVDNVQNSVNLTKEFGVAFDNAKMLNDSASNLLVLQGGNMRKVDVQARQLSAILAEKVISFDYRNNEVVMISGDEEAGYTLNVLKISNGEITKLSKIASPSKVSISRFYDQKYIAVLSGSTLKLYTEEDFDLVSEYDLGFTPSAIKVGHGGEFIVLSHDADVATLDMESMLVREWVLPSNTFGWLDDDMIFSVDDNELYVYDFDGLNERKLTKDVSNNRPVTITNDKWLYYFNGDFLMREWLIPR